VPGDIHPTDAATGIARTAQVLAKSTNRAVLPVLLAGLKSSRADIRAATIRAAFRRRERATHAQLIEHFTFLSESDRIVVGDAHRSMPHHAAAALTVAIFKGDANQCKNACRIVSISGDVDLLPALVKAAEDKKHNFRTDIAATILELATRVQRELALWASGDRTAPHDPSFKRHHVLVSLEQSVSRFAQHRRKEILDAFLLLAPVDNATLNKILRDPNHPCHSTVVAELTSTQDFDIIERLVEMLRDIETPAAVLRIISARTDERFVDILLNGLKRPVPIRVLHNMKGLNRVAWLEEQRGLLLEFDGRAQAIAVELALASGLDRGAAFEFLAFLLQNGLAEARRACCQAIANFESARADELVLAMLDDPDAGVQAAAVRQLRARRVPDALQRLVALLDSRSPEVRDAARSSLAEFNFTRYRTMFDLLDEQSAHTTGILVRKVDHGVPQKLAEELSSPSISTKLRGIEMAIAMEATNDVRQQLIDLVEHENVAVRKEAIVALANCHGELVVATLKLAATEPTHSIAEAAQQSLAKLSRDRSQIARAQRGGGSA
jgi:HEAT repeat protein